MMLVNKKQVARGMKKWNTNILVVFSLPGLGEKQRVEEEGIKLRMDIEELQFTVKVW